MIPIFLNGESYYGDPDWKRAGDADLRMAVRIASEEGIPFHVGSHDTGIVFWNDAVHQELNEPAGEPTNILPDVDEFGTNGRQLSYGEFSDTELDPNEYEENKIATFPPNTNPNTVIAKINELTGYVGESLIRELASRIPINPSLILEDIESDLRVFVNMNITKLRVKEQAFEVGQTRWDDPGDYPSAAGGRPLPSYDYVEEIYGAAELAFDIPIQNIPPNIRWRIEHVEMPVRKYEMEGQHVQRIVSSVSRRALGTLVLTDEQGNEAHAGVELLNDALDEELYRVKQDLDELMMPPNVNQTYTLQIKWANWEQVDDKLTCTIGVTAELD